MSTTRLMAISRQPDYSPQEYADLVHYNTWVQLYLLSALLPVLLFATGANLVSKWLSYRRRDQAKQFIGKLRPSGACSRTGKGCTRWVPGTMLAVKRKMGCRRSRLAERLGMSSLSELAAIAAYFALNIILVVCGAAGNIDYMAHHAARLSFANIPLVIGLASKNNTISYATGISYESLNVFHRWIARLFLVLLLIHVSGRIYINVPVVNPSASGMYAPNGGAYIRWGIVAFFAFAILIVSAARPLRNRWYQFFIISHVILFLLAIVASAIHRPSIAPWLYAGVIIYFLDRILRTLRIVWNHTIRVVRPEDVGDPVGLVEVISEDSIRVTVKTTLKWNPGQHVFLHVPFISAGGHPFSVCSIDRPLMDTGNVAPRVSTVVLIIRVRKGVTRRLYSLAVGDPESRLSLSQKTSVCSLDDTKAYPTATISPVWAEGAYGLLAHLDYYQTVLLVAGGSGVSFTLPLMLDMVRRARSMHLGHQDAAVATERLTFIWVIREEEHVEWIGPILREAISLAPPNFLRVQIHVTSRTFVPPSPSPALSTSTNMTEPLRTPSLQPFLPPFLPTRQKRLSITSRLAESTLPFAHSVMAGVPATGVVDPILRNSSSEALSSPNLPGPLTLHEVRPPLPLFAGRPDLRAILETEIMATEFSDYVAVGTCGPSAMTQDLANAVSDAIHPDKVLRGEKRRNIRLHCEEFGW